MVQLTKELSKDLVSTSVSSTAVVKLTKELSEELRQRAHRAKTRQSSFYKPVEEAAASWVAAEERDVLSEDALTVQRRGTIDFSGAAPMQVEIEVEEVATVPDDIIMYDDQGIPIGGALSPDDRV